MRKLQDKIRRIKKYVRNVAKGKNYNPVKPHDQKVLDLSKKVWGSGEGSIALNGLSEQYKCASGHHTAGQSEEIGFDEGFREMQLPEGVWELIGGPKGALKEKLKKLHVAELELFLQRNKLMRDKANVMLEELKSSD